MVSFLDLDGCILGLVMVYSGGLLGVNGVKTEGFHAEKLNGSTTMVYFPTIKIDLSSVFFDPNSDFFVSDGDFSSTAGPRSVWTPF